MKNCKKKIFSENFYKKISFKKFPFIEIVQQFYISFHKNFLNTFLIFLLWKCRKIMKKEYLKQDYKNKIIF